jgi:hypothetical protein
MRYTLTTKLWLSVTESRDAEPYDVPLVVRFRMTDDGPEITDAAVGGEPVQNWLWIILQDDVALAHEMIAEARDADEYARDSHADMIREERMPGN